MSLDFQFYDAKKAKEFVAAVKKKFDLDGEIEKLPQVHIDRAPLDWDDGSGIEKEIQQLGEEYGGAFLGT